MTTGKRRGQIISYMQQTSGLYGLKSRPHTVSWTRLSLFSDKLSEVVEEIHDNFQIYDYHETSLPNNLYHKRRLFSSQRDPIDSISDTIQRLYDSLDIHEETEE